MAQNTNLQKGGKKHSQTNKEKDEETSNTLFPREQITHC